MKKSLLFLSIGFTTLMASTGEIQNIETREAALQLLTNQHTITRDVRTFRVARASRVIEVETNKETRTARITRSVRNIENNTMKKEEVKTFRIARLNRDVRESRTNRAVRYVKVNTRTLLAGL